jgi:hypothetical protein
MKKNFRRAVIEVSTLMFLLYINVAMGYYSLSSVKQGAPNILDVLKELMTWQMFFIALFGGMTAYCIYEKYIRENSKK